MSSGIKMKNPKVTVLMSVYNGEKYLREAVDSILGQTFKDFEFLIVNDGSTDKSGEILESYNDPRIEIINNNKNIGISKSRNKGLRIARGKYIAVMDADDISLPRRLEKEVEFLEQNRNMGLVGTDYLIINEKGKVIHAVRCINGYRELKIKLLEGNQFAHGSIMFKKECTKKVGFYREEFMLALDYDLILRISEKFEVSNIPEFLYKWRINIESVSVKKKALQDKYALMAIEFAKERRQSGKDKLQSLKKEEIDNLLDELISSSEGQNKKEAAKGYFSYGLVLLNGRDYKGALKLVTKSFIIYPLDINNWLLLFKTIIVSFFPKSFIIFLKYIKQSLYQRK